MCLSYYVCLLCNSLIPQTRLCSSPVFDVTSRCQCPVQNIHQLRVRTTCYNKVLFGGYQCMVTISLRFRAPLRFLFTVIAVVVFTLHLLPLPPLYIAWPFITEKPPDDTGIRFDVSASRCECPSHCFSVIRPRCVVCKLLPVLQTKQLSCQDVDCRSTFAYLYVFKEAIPDYSDKAPTSI